MNDNLIELERKAIQRLKAFEPEDGYRIRYSGGKDSDVIRILAELSGVKHTLVNSHTTVDAPETVNYIKTIPNIVIDYPHYEDGTPKSMWNLIEKHKMPPTRFVRYCCEELKEVGGKGKLSVTGVRWAESPKRSESAGVVKILGKPKRNQKTADEIGADYRVSKQGGLIMNQDNDRSRRMVEQCYRTSSTLVNPIVEWTDADVWEFLNHYGCESNPLYQCGFKRIGCIGCPIAGKNRYKEFARYPQYKKNYIKAFDRMLKNMPNKSKVEWENGLDVFKWWMGENPNQLSLFEEEI